MTEPRWATLKEAALHSGVSARTLRRWIADGRLAAHRIGPRKVQVDLNDLDALRTPIPNHRAATGATTTERSA